VKEFKNIKDFYKPIQPTIKAGNSEIVYKEILPDKNVNNFVYCFWQLKTTTTLKKPFIYRVVSDGCIDIFFNHNQPSQNFIMGFCRKYTEFPISKKFDYIGVRFLPSAFPLLFEVNAKKLSNQSHNLKDILSSFSSWIEFEINAQQSFEKIAELLNLQLGNMIKSSNFDFDERFFNSLNLIFKNNGNLNYTESIL